jgi:hypothetical protein
LNSRNGPGEGRREGVFKKTFEREFAAAAPVKLLSREFAGFTTFPCDLLQFKSTSVFHVLSNVLI